MIIIKKAIIWISITVLIIICIMAYDYYSFVEESTNNYLPTSESDTIRVAYIGDSWAERHFYHQCEINRLIQQHSGKAARTVSYGIGGLTSKELYKLLTEDSKMRQILTEGVDYCIVAVGVNDTNQKMSPTYYKKSINCIINYLINCKISPIIIEIPDYNIKKALKDQKPHRKILRYITMFFTRTPIDCKQLFRNELDTLVATNNYRDRIDIIRSREWENSSYKPTSLYQTDGMHLNDFGYKVLDSCIAKHIIEKEIKKNHTD